MGLSGRTRRPASEKDEMATSRGLNDTQVESDNNDTAIPWILELDMEDSNWVMTSAFIIFTMQTGKLSAGFLSLSIVHAIRLSFTTLH